jgi:hypothetical protein
MPSVVGHTRPNEMQPSHTVQYAPTSIPSSMEPRFDGQPPQSLWNTYGIAKKWRDLKIELDTLAETGQPYQRIADYRAGFVKGLQKECRTRLPIWGSYMAPELC